MTIKDAQQAVDTWIKTYGVRYYSELTNMAILSEEVGEVARIMARTPERFGGASFRCGFSRPPEIRRCTKGRLGGENSAELRTVARMLAGQPPPAAAAKNPRSARTIWQAQEQVLQSPAAAHGIDVATLRELPGQVALLVLAEAVAAQSPRVDELRAALAHAYPRRFLDKALRYVRDGGELDIVEPTLRATLLFARSRVAPPSERQALRSEATRLARLSGSLSRAIVAWSKLDEKTENRP